MAKLTGKVNKTISKVGNQMFLVFNKTDNSTGTRRFYIKIFESMYDHSVIPAAVKTPGNKFAGIIMPGINMVL